jgi:hypothetical protein
MQYFNPKNNDMIESNLTVQVAIDIIKNNAPISDGFAHDIARKNNPSQGQIFWIIKKAEQYNPNKTPSQVERENVFGSEVGAGLVKISEMFQAAKVYIKRPKIKLKNNNEEIVISMAPDTGKNSGFLYVKVSGLYMGKISPEGRFAGVSGTSKELREYLASFSQNPEVMAAQYGKETGNCCFCSRLLTDDRSVTVGYGPICAENFGLNWG